MKAENESLDTLLDRIVGGETDLYLQVVQRHELMLRSYLAGQLYNQAEVDDLAQDAFIAAYRDLDSFRRGEDFGAWLRGIARNRLLTYFRSKQRRSTATDRFRQEVARLAEQELEASIDSRNNEQIDLLLHCISRLPDKLRHVVRSGLEDAQPSALAEELKTSVAAIYQLHYRANKLLRECMTQKTSQ